MTKKAFSAHHRGSKSPRIAQKESAIKPAQKVRHRDIVRSLGASIVLATRGRREMRPVRLARMSKGKKDQFQLIIRGL